MTDKNNKVRTSITIDPELLKRARKAATKSLSSLIEEALQAHLGSTEESGQAASE